MRVALSAVVLTVLLVQRDPSEWVAVLAGAPRWTFVLPAVLLTLNSGLHALRITVLLRAGGVRVSPLTVMAATLRGNFAGLALPTGGSELAKVGFIARVTGAPEVALAAVLVGRLLELAPWTLLLLWGLRWGLSEAVPLLGLAAAGAALIFTVVLSGGLWVVTRPVGRAASKPPAALGGLAARLSQSMRRVIDALALLGRDPSRLVQALLLTIPFSLLNCAVTYLIVGAHLPGFLYMDALALFPAADTIIALPVTISGLGVREGVYIVALAPLGVLPAQAVVMGLTRWLAQLERAAVGGVILLLFGAGRPPRPRPAGPS